MRILMTLLLAMLAGDVSWAQARKPVPTPEIQTIGEGVVWRTSENKNEHEMTLPPWKEITVINIFGFKKRPVIGERVTIIPLEVDIPPLDLRITKAEKKEDPCDERSPAWWEVELEPIKLKNFFDIEALPNRSAEYPFDVAVIYPAVKVARQVKRDQLTRGTLPRGVFINTVKAAIDLTGDGKPDVLIVKYCCDDTKKPADECDLTCGKIFRKVRNSWKLVDNSSPC